MYNWTVPSLLIMIVAIKQFKPTDATTNPSLLLSAAQIPTYRYLVDQAVENGKAFPQDQRVAEIMDQLVSSIHYDILNDCRWLILVVKF